jgi:transposase
MKKKSVTLSKEQRGYLEKVIKTGEEEARTIQHAHILLKADSGPDGPGWSGRQIHEAFGMGTSTVLRICRRFQDGGLEPALKRSPQPPRPDKRKVDGEQEALLMTLLRSQPPAGRERWSLRVVASRLVELELVSSVSYETVRQVLKKTSSSPD